mmetsp:Transcript_55795/g.103237  ORF Transcript_55795/g.103237 Transcript_55795/m.103237 type:complete len:394 (-) Transcript_55795:14-1195(-)
MWATLFRLLAGVLCLGPTSALTSTCDEDVDIPVALLQSAMQLHEATPVLSKETSVIEVFANESTQPTAGQGIGDGTLVSRAKEHFPDPVFYLHLPKTGGGFATTVAHTVCADELPENYYLVGPKNIAASNYSCRHRFARFNEGHQPLSGRDFDSLPEPAASHVVTLLREPTQRLLSGFYHSRHDCPSIRLSRFCVSEDSASPECTALASVAATPEELDPYAHCVGSCQTRLIAGYRCAGDVPMPSDLARALDRIDKFAFVGLTEEFERSVCLFHLRFGGRCLDVEFVNSRQGGHSSNSSTGYSTTAVNQYVDISLAADYSIYDRARTRFWREVKEYGATDEVCSRICPAYGKAVDLQQFNGERSSGLQMRPHAWSLVLGLSLAWICVSSALVP